MAGSYRTPIVASEAHQRARARARDEEREARRQRRERARAAQQFERTSEERLRYQIAWEQYARRERLGSGVLYVLLIVPPWIAASALWEVFLDGPLLFPGLVLYLVSLVGVLVVSALVARGGSILMAELSLRSFRCPRCGQRFQPTRHSARECQHCALPRGAPEGE